MPQIKIIRITGKAKDVFGAMAKLARAHPTKTIGEIKDERIENRRRLNDKSFAIPMF